MARFNGDRKKAPSILKFAEKALIKVLTPYIAPLFETYELTWLTLLWSICILIFSYLAKTDVFWLIGVSTVIALQYITDLFDGAVGRKNKTGLIKWGYYFDHLLDFIFLAAIIIGYSFILTDIPAYQFLLLLTIFAGFMVNSFLDFSATNVFKTTYFLIGPTETRLFFIIVNTLVIIFGLSFVYIAFSYVIAFSFFFLCLVVYMTQKRLWQKDLRERKRFSFLLSKLKLTRKYLHFKLKYLFLLFFGLFVYLNIYVYLTNPFNPGTIIQSPFSTNIVDGKILLEKNYSLHVGDDAFQKMFAFYRAGVHILANVYFGSHPAKGTTVDSIITDIHQLRFNPKYPYLISGDQFSVLYPRNLGVFYASMLDPKTALNKSDWEERQRIYLQSTAYAIDTFSKANNIYTTIIPIGIHTVTPVNIYTYPSDSLYGIFYALQDLRTQNTSATYPIQTIDSANELLYEYFDSLRFLLNTYKQTVFDTKTGLVRKDIHISSARDASIRESSFYDNVIYWKTLQLASELGIEPQSNSSLEKLKSRILHAFWYEKGGYFLNDLSQDSIKTHIYSSDWLIAISTGFLNMSDPKEQLYVQRAISYIQENKIDQPLPLRYEKTSDPAKEFSFVKYFVPSYGSSAIWSYWGIEYIKTLLLLYKETGNKGYFITATNDLNKYAKNIVTYKGFPEVYNQQGKFLQNAFYKSIRQTGWVVDFEEAEVLANDVKNYYSQ